MRRKDLLYLAVFGLALFMLGNWMMPVTDPVESNYTQTAKEMIAAGDYMSPRIFGNYWYDKPILFYLELIAAFKMFGMTDFAARFFPAVFAIAGVLVTYAFAAKLYSRKVGLVSAVLLATTVEYWYLGHAIITDMTLWLTVSLTLISFYKGYETDKPVYYYLAFAAAAVAVLTKGPIGLALPGLVILVFLTWQRALRMLLSIHMLGGLALFFAIVSLWYLPMYQLHGSDFIDTFLGVHNALRATVPEHPRNSVWYYYLLVFVAGFFPWSFVIVPVFFKKLFTHQLHLPAGDKERFLMVWALAVFVAFECMASKYTTYTFPYMMPLAIFMGQYFVAHEKMFWRMAKTMSAVYIVAALAIVPFVLQGHSGKDLASLLRANSTADTTVMTYGVRYPVSISYYSGTMPSRLVATDADIEKKRPQKMSWTATNIMPFAAVTDMDLSKDTLIVTNQDSKKDLGVEIPGFWQEIGSDEQYAVYKLVPGHDDGRVDMKKRKNDTLYGTIMEYLSGDKNKKEAQNP